MILYFYARVSHSKNKIKKFQILFLRGTLLKKISLNNMRAIQSLKAKNWKKISSNFIE